VEEVLEAEIYQSFFKIENNIKVMFCESKTQKHQKSCLRIAEKNS